MKGRTPTKDEKKWMGAICEDGCCVCKKLWNIYSPAMPHHIEGKTKKYAHFKTIPLCHNHHQGSDGIHNNKAAWKKKHGSEYSFLRKTQESLDLYPIDDTLLPS